MVLRKQPTRLAAFLFYCGAFPLAARSFWDTSTVPGTPEVQNDSAAVTLGLDFFADAPGYVWGVRFYKGPDNTGPHIGDLWSSTGNKLAEVVFSNESPSGWQTAFFSAPISIAASTVYVVSYFAPNGAYAQDQNYSWPAVDSTLIHFGNSSQPGLFAYGSNATFPSSTYQSSNYYVDLIYSREGPGYSISGQVNGAAERLFLTGPVNGTTATDNAGDFLFTGLSNGTYQVTPNQDVTICNPSSASLTINGSNLVAPAFSCSKPQHSASLTWNASVSPNIAGYRAYRGNTSGGPYQLLNSSFLISGTSYEDGTVSAGQTYYYVVTAVDIENLESAYSNEAVAVVPGL